MGKRQVFLRTVFEGTNLPTVWSHVFAGWWLAGGGNAGALPTVLVGVSLLFTAGSFKNPAFDNPPEPGRDAASRFAPRLSYDARWRWSWAFLVCGIAALLISGLDTAILGALLVGSILAFHWNSRKIWHAPVYLGLNRALTCVLGGLAAADFSGAVLWSAIALGIYFAGVHYLARTQSLPAPAKYWPCLLMLVPVFHAYLMNQGEYREAALVLSALLLLWVLRCLRPLFWPSEPHRKPEWGGLVAGAVFVDLLAVADAPRPLSIAFLALFFSAWLFQKQRISQATEGAAAVLR